MPKTVPAGGSSVITLPGTTYENVAVSLASAVVATKSTRCKPVVVTFMVVWNNCALAVLVTRLPLSYRDKVAGSDAVASTGLPPIFFKNEAYQAVAESFAGGCCRVYIVENIATVSGAANDRTATVPESQASFNTVSPAGMLKNVRILKLFFQILPETLHRSRGVIGAPSGGYVFPVARPCA